jgi:hypothetical protein
MFGLPDLCVTTLYTILLFVIWITVILMSAFCLADLMDRIIAHHVEFAARARAHAVAAAALRTFAVAIRAGAAAA